MDQNDECPHGGHNPLIELDRVSVNIASSVILRDVTLRVDKGEYIGLIGKNGSGKTTLFRTILGLVPPSAGTVKVFGEAPRGALLKRIGYTPQMRSIEHEFPATVEDIVALGLGDATGPFGMLTKAQRSKIQLALHKVKMEGYINRPIGHLSGGEQQKIMLAQALVREPEILLLDEPTSALDHIIIKDFLGLLTDLNKVYGITLIVIQHNLDLVIPFCSRLVILRRSIVFDGDPKDERVAETVRASFM
ncbi:MAG: ABC transporter ATP-binding protein [Candidatus Lokiarchaeota archaeon]|nr:ABC transporter ATP-binding protein [Candidatus Lokiarchaeota archaeon]